MNPSQHYRYTLFVLIAVFCLAHASQAEPKAKNRVTPKPVKTLVPKPTPKSAAPPAPKEIRKPDKSEDEEETPPSKFNPHDPDEAQYEVVEKGPTGDHYTSVIIDASDFHVTRSMSPKICREDGSKVWPNLSYIDPEYVLSYGIVVYARSLEEAKTLKRAGKNPLIIRALRHGASEDDPVLSAADAEAILAANKRNKCLDKFKVIFILDKPTAK